MNFWWENQDVTNCAHILMTSNFTSYHELFTEIHFSLLNFELNQTFKFTFILLLTTRASPAPFWLGASPSSLTSLKSYRNPDIIFLITM